jgi:predicted transcriptional regulator
VWFDEFVADMILTERSEGEVTAMTITLRPEVETRLQEAARREGVEPDEYANKLLDKALPHRDQATLDLLAKWEADTWTDDPEEIARRQLEFEEFKRGMNRNRLEMEGPNARIPYP